MSSHSLFSYDRLRKQKWLWRVVVGLGAAVLLVSLVWFLFSDGNAKPVAKQVLEPVETVSDGIQQDNLRIAELEKQREVQANELEYLKSVIHDFHEDRQLVNRRFQDIQNQMSVVNLENESLQDQLKYYHLKQEEMSHANEVKSQSKMEFSSENDTSSFWCWGGEEDESEDSRNVKYEIPPGTLVKGIIVQGVSQPVGIGKPADPEVALIRITSAGKLPKKVRLALKGSNLICSTESILSNRRVRVRGETLSKHKKNGDFIVTDVSAVISGPGGKSGVPARVVSYGGVQAGYSAISSALGAASSTLETVLNNQTIEKLSQIGPDKAILNSDVFTNIGLRGTNGGFDKLTDYYIKMADLYSPTLEIDMGTEVSILFTSGVTLGEKNIKKRLQHERRESGDY